MKKIYSFFSYFLLAFLLSSCSNDKNVYSPEIVKIKRIIPYHIVIDGDTVGSIATKYKMTRVDLIKLNKLEPPYQLYNGQKMIVVPKIEDSSESEQISIKEQDNTIPKMEHHSYELNQDSINVTEDLVTVDDIKEDNETPIISDSEYEWPIIEAKSKISQKFGKNDVDGGIVIDASVGTPVKSISDGIVMISGIPNGEASAYGITVVIKHTAKKKMSIYANLKETSVTVGQKIKKGTIIGKVGKSGTIAKKPQLYFEVNDLAGNGRKAIDPEKLLSK